MRKFQADLRWKKPLVASDDPDGGHCAVCGRTESRYGSAIQCCGARTDGCTTGRQLPELHQLDRQRDRPGRRRRCSARRRRVVAHGTRLRTMVVRGGGLAGCLWSHPLDRVLDHERNRWSDLTVRRQQKARTLTRQSASVLKRCGLPITRPLLLDVSLDLGNGRDGNSAIAQRHYLGTALAGTISRTIVAGGRRSQPAARRNDDVRDRWWIHQVDVLGNRVSDAPAVF